MAKNFHAPIVRYRVDGYLMDGLRNGKFRLLVLKDGHAEVLGGETKSEALGWLSRGQVEKVERMLSSNDQAHARPNNL